MSFAELGFLALSGWLPKDHATRHLLSASYLPVNQVHSSKGVDQFGSQDLPTVHPLGSLLMTKGLSDTRRVSGEERPLLRAQCWTSVYDTGQFIAPHKDAVGDLQFLVVLERPPSECAGRLHICGRDGKQHVLELDVGDALVFCASTLTHSTEPLVATGDHPRPKRTVAVGRYFFKSET